MGPAIRRKHLTLVISSSSAELELCRSILPNIAAGDVKPSQNDASKTRLVRMFRCLPALNYLPATHCADSGAVHLLHINNWQSPIERRSKVVTENESTNENLDIPASLKQGKKEPVKTTQVRIPQSWWDELSALAREYDQDVSTFLREAIEDWLHRARKVRQVDTSGKKPQCS